MYTARLITFPLILILVLFSHGSDARKQLSGKENGNVLLLEDNLVADRFPPPSSPSGGGNPMTPSTSRKVITPDRAETERFLRSAPVLESETSVWL
ncbi:hypothetical protein DKX38_025682 [Salix brachista]|uniref:Uncharacterized protein n=1 Tax=Salix brachista TaxID=2182728 RepID=A0A5N5JV07_9ROSI|nr:hypothetical protein DKX38_025682 [Salix brachista]